MELDNTTWHSAIGSSMTFQIDGNGDITGLYHTAPGGMTAKLAGRIDLLGGGAFGWTVAWPKGNYPSNSATSWVANITIIDGVPTIESSWMIREELNNNPYNSTVTGCENYTQTPPSQETVEANKKKRPPHPL